MLRILYWWLDNYDNWWIYWVGLVDFLIMIWIFWWGKSSDNERWCMIVVDDNLVLRTIHMCEKELTISIGKILLLLENSILGRVSSIQNSALLKWPGGSCLVGYLPEYHSYVLTLNGMSECWELLPKRFSEFLVYIGWVVVDGETWIFEIDHDWEGGYKGIKS